MEDKRKIEDMKQLVCKRRDYLGSARFWNEVKELLADGYEIFIGKDRKTAPSMANIPRVTLVKYEQPKVKRKAPAKKKSTDTVETQE